MPGGKWHTCRGKALQDNLPQPIAAAVAAGAIGGDQQPGGARESLRSHALPPAPQAGGGKLRRVMIDAHADPALVMEQVIDAIGNRLAQQIAHRAAIVRLPVQSPFAARIDQPVRRQNDQQVVLGSVFSTGW